MIRRARTGIPPVVIARLRREVDAAKHAMDAAYTRRGRSGDDWWAWACSLVTWQQAREKLARARMK